MTRQLSRALLFKVSFEMRIATPVKRTAPTVLLCAFPLLFRPLSCALCKVQWADACAGHLTRALWRCITRSYKSTISPIHLFIRVASVFIYLSCRSVSASARRPSHLYSRLVFWPALLNGLGRAKPTDMTSRLPSLCGCLGHELSHSGFRNISICLAAMS